MNDKEKKMAKEAWYERVWKQRYEVDSGEEYIWEGLALGFFLGFGATLDEAHELLKEVEY
jgi:hypothetical protein